jgi:hypothetical protein
LVGGGNIPVFKYNRVYSLYVIGTNLAITDPHHSNTGSQL